MDYTHLNHNSLVSQEKVVTKGMIIKGVYCIIIDGSQYHHQRTNWFQVSIPIEQILILRWHLIKNSPIWKRDQPIQTFLKTT
jgi:hypothetical protein